MLNHVSNDVLNLNWITKEGTENEWMNWVIIFDGLFSNLEMVAPSCTAAVLEGLETSRVYTFRVYSENAVGMSDALQGPKAVRIQPGIGNWIFFPHNIFLYLFCSLAFIYSYSHQLD